MHHMCFEVRLVVDVPGGQFTSSHLPSPARQVDNIHAAVEELKAKNVRVLDPKPKVRQGLNCLISSVGGSPRPPQLLHHPRRSAPTASSSFSCTPRCERPSSPIVVG